MKFNEEVKSWRTVTIGVLIGGLLFLTPGVIAVVWWMSGTPQLPEAAEVDAQIQQQREQVEQSRLLVLDALRAGGNVTVVRDMVGGYGDSRGQLRAIDGLREQLGLQGILGTRTMNGVRVRWTLIQDERGSLDLYWVGGLEAHLATADPLPQGELARVADETELTAGWSLVAGAAPPE